MMLEKFVMTEQEKSHTEIRENVLREQQLAEERRHEYVCPVCSKKYRYSKCLEKHVKQLHPNITLMPSPAETVKASVMPASTTKSDDRFDYACVRLALCMLFRKFDDAVREGDGVRILRCWKIAMRIFRAHHNNKYALASSYLQAATQAILTPRQAHSLR